MKYVRNHAVVRPQLVVNAGGQVICKAACKIQVPLRFKDKGLADVGIRTFAYGLFPIILSTGEYTLMNVTAKIELMPDRVTTTTVDEVEYYEFHFDANSVVIKSVDVLKQDDMMFSLFDEFIFLGKLPWYVDYNDAGKLLDTAKKYGGSNVGANLEVIEFLIAMITRLSSNKAAYLRTVAESYADVNASKITFVPLKSVYYSVNSTLNKLAGSHMRAGIDSALVSPTTSVGKNEKILRS